MGFGGIFTGLRQGGAGVKYAAGGTAPYSGVARTAAVGGGIKPAIGKGQSVVRPGGCPDYDMVCTGATGALAVQTAVAVLVGNPNSYTYAGTAVTTDRGRGRPHVGIGACTSLTKPGPGQIVGSMSYGGDPAASFPAFVCDPLDALVGSNGGLNLPMQEGETLTFYMDNNNTNEQVQGFYVISYGSPGHRWPEDVEQLIKISGLGNKIKEVWAPRIGLTASLTTPVNTVVMNAAGTTDDRWIDGESEYYVLGAMTQSVAAASGVLNFSQGLPDYLKVRNNDIPYGNTFYAASGSGKGRIVPAYWPIGPFTSANPVQVGATGTAAAALVVRVILGKC